VRLLGAVIDINSSRPLGLAHYLERLDELNPEDLEYVNRLSKKLDEVRLRSKSRDSFLHFVQEAWPAFILGEHHALMARAFEKVMRGELRRLIINMPPRHTKSEFASYLLPAWFLGQKPDGKVIQTSHTSELAVNFGRKVRNLVSSEEYQQIFPGVGLQPDSKAAGRWNTSDGGEYFAIGVGGAVTGKGADLLIIDDPHSEQEGQSADPAVFDRVHEWYTSGPRQRLQPGGSIVIVMTRWHKRDLTGQILKSSIQRKGVDEWEVIELPAILPSGKSLWPGYWSIEEMERLKAELPISKWSAQYQQDPTSDLLHAILSSSLGIPLSSKRNVPITQLARPGGSFTGPAQTVNKWQTSYCWMRKKIAWNFLN